MCTLSIFPAGAGHILTMSRDEVLTRAEAAPAHVVCADGALRYWHCVDAASSGSWFGVRGDALVAALLNRYQDVSQRRGSLQPRSRGVLVRTLVEAAPGTTLEDLAATLKPDDFDPFDLYVYQHGALQGLHWSGATLQLLPHPLSGPRLFTSSSQQAVEARACRQREFHRFVREHPAPEAERIFDALHLREHDGDPALAIRMRRPGRATRSVCQAQVGEGPLQFRYKPLRD